MAGPREHQIVYQEEIHDNDSHDCVASCQHKKLPLDDNTDSLNNTLQESRPETGFPS